LDRSSTQPTIHTRQWRSPPDPQSCDGPQCALSKLNILEWTTKVNSAAFSAEQIFQAVARLRVPDGVEAEELKQGLERLGDEMMINITVKD